MFKESVIYYDLIKSNKDYKSEAEQIKNIIAEREISNCSILEIACGTGELMKFLKKDYKIDGLDINSLFIDIAKQKNPECEYYIEDMRDFHINKKYDIIICLYGAIGYTKNKKNLLATFKSFKKHLNENGYIIIEPWYTPLSWEPNKIHITQYTDCEISIVRMAQGEPNGNILFHYLVGKEGEITHFTEYFYFGLFFESEIIDAFSSIGFEVIHLKNVFQKKGLYINTNIR